MIRDIELAIDVAKSAKLNLFEFLQNINSIFEELNSISSSMLRLNHFCYNFDKTYPHKSLINDALSTVEITEDINLLINLFDLMELLEKNSNFYVNKKNLCDFIFNHKDFSHKSFYRQKNYLLSIGYDNLNFELVQSYTKSPSFDEDFFKDFIKSINGNDNPLRKIKHPLKNKIINDLRDYCLQEDNSSLSFSITEFIFKHSKTLHDFLNKDSESLTTKELIILLDLLNYSYLSSNDIILTLIKRKDFSNYFNYLIKRNKRNFFLVNNFLVNNPLVNKILNYILDNNFEMYEFEDYYKNIYYKSIPKNLHSDCEIFYEKMLVDLFKVKDKKFIIEVICELKFKGILEKTLNSISFSKRELLTIINLLENRDDLKQIVILKIDPELAIFI